MWILTCLKRVLMCSLFLLPEVYRTCVEGSILFLAILVFRGQCAGLRFQGGGLFLATWIYRNLDTALYFNWKKSSGCLLLTGLWFPNWWEHSRPISAPSPTLFLVPSPSTTTLRGPEEDFHFKPYFATAPLRQDSQTKGHSLPARCHCLTKKKLKEETRLI